MFQTLVEDPSQLTGGLRLWATECALGFVPGEFQEDCVFAYVECRIPFADFVLTFARPEPCFDSRVKFRE